MGKRNTIKVDINQMFLPNTMMDSETLRKEAMQSPLWPIAVAIYGATECRVRVSEYLTLSDVEEIVVMVLSSEHGFPIASLKYDPRSDEERRAESANETGESRFSITATDNIFYKDSYGLSGVALYTNSQRYAVQKMGRGPHDVRGRIMHTLASINESLGDTVRPIIDKAVDRTYGESLSSRPTTTIPTSLTNTLLRFFMDEVGKNDVPLKDIEMIKDIHRRHLTKNEKFDKALGVARSLFEGEKIIFFPSVRRGVIVGKTNMLPALAAIDQYDKGESLPYASGFAYMPEVNFSVPLRWYKSLQHVPDDLRKELEIQLVMLKAHTNGDSLIPSFQKMYEERFWVDLGVSCYPSHGGSSSPMLILNSMSAA